MVKRKVSAKQKTAAHKNIKKARAKWKGMSKAARAKAMPSRPYKVHTKAWDEMVKKLRKEGKVKSPEAVATWKLGKKSFLKRKLKTKPTTKWKRVVKKVTRKAHAREGYCKKPHLRKSHVKDVKPGPGKVMKRVKGSRVKRTCVKPTRVKKSRMTSKGWKKK